MERVENRRPRVRLVRMIFSYLVQLRTEWVASGMLTRRGGGKETVPILGIRRFQLDGTGSVRRSKIPRKERKCLCLCVCLEMGKAGVNV